MVFVPIRKVIIEIVGQKVTCKWPTASGINVAASGCATNEGPYKLGRCKYNRFAAIC